MSIWLNQTMASVNTPMTGNTLMCDQRIKHITVHVVTRKLVFKISGDFEAKILKTCLLPIVVVWMDLISSSQSPVYIGIRICLLFCSTCSRHTFNTPWCHG